jgi:glycosyltransferase involved in cell wall biosynthesis
MQLSRRTVWFQNITPTKFFESLANGVPVITSDIGDCGELVRETECGVVVDETNVDDIVRGVSALIEDPSLRHRMAENGLRLIKERFNWEAMGEKLIRIYEEHF